MVGLWRAARNNPILRLELRRIRRRRWWPGRRFFLFYPALLGVALGYGVMLVLTGWPGVQAMAVITGVPVGLVLGMIVWLLSAALPWIAPALAAPTIARERELHTFDTLRVTLLSDRAIVLGKLGGCLAQLWPGILLLILLTPFQLGGVLGSSTLCLCPSSYDLAALMLASGLGVEYFIGGLVLQVLMGTLRPLADVLLHAALGMFVSALVRSSRVAIAISYGTVLVTRVVVWLAASVLGAVLLYGLLEPVAVDLALVGPGMSAFGWLSPNLVPLAVIVIEVIGATALVWGAIWRLERE